MDKTTKKPSSKSKTRGPQDKKKVKSDSAKKAAKADNDLEGFSPGADDTFEQDAITQAIQKDQQLEPVPKPKKKKKKQGGAGEAEDESGKKDQGFSIEDINEIEKKMEDKIQAFQMKMREIDRQKIQPITLQLIQKYSFTRKFRSQLLSPSLQANSGEASETASTAFDDTQSEVSDSRPQSSASSLIDHYTQADPNLAEKMIYLRTIRLDFLDLGPKVENLEIFEHLENLYLQHNKLNEIGHGLMHNKKLIFLALANNQIKHFEGLGHLKQLAFLM
ncbi:hypothetical protein FGO68_gene2363 [Halteria grandinella]|uniref:Uncharacterized protein n=1 Tax=Halteria grandinella TaxID=5974 RepID=A0A8J8NP28_HALGN|nr:hypothetical protein FGO68_gene2363 [Halteria grandinella]